MKCCEICGEEKSKGITIYGHYICDECEAAMINTDVTDKKYKYFIYKLKEMWFLKEA